MVQVHHRTATVLGHRVFYREAGPAGAPVVLLLHGFPTSSRMFRHLIPALANRYHVLAPDHIGFGQSATPPPTEFPYTFDALTDVTQTLLDQLGVDRFSMYVQDYGAPIGWRLVLRRPAAVQAIISQNGNAYDDGFVESFWAGLWAYAQSPTPDTEGPVRAALELDAIRWQYLTGVAEPDLVDPDTWVLDHAEVNRPGNAEIQLALFRDYASNPPLYPSVHEYFRASQVPLLAIWGNGDEIFAPAGAEAFAHDLPDAEIHLLDGGHFLLESALDTAVGYIRGFLGRTVNPAHADAA
jgi:pimeloyl-ACP methyl ester carboxylesterase